MEEGKLVIRYEIDQLSEIFPNVSSVTCPSKYCKDTIRSGVVRTLWETVMHLNDIHRWPRTEKDRNYRNTHLPTIYGWMKEQDEKNGWDLTCRAT